MLSHNGLSGSSHRASVYDEAGKFCFARAGIFAMDLLSVVVVYALLVPGAIFGCFFDGGFYCSPANRAIFQAPRCAISWQSKSLANGNFSLRVRQPKPIPTARIRL